ncbi:hypothetical protein TNCV_3221651 [Trichonephila clavipes]|nr:hypothetical protein TNCV_3221651 [Trichonephila clavipes]
MLNGRTELHIFDRGSVTAIVRRTLAVEELLESEDITRMDRPAYSPDLNLIERVECFGETYCSTLTSSGEHPTTQKDAD